MQSTTKEIFQFKDIAGFSAFAQAFTSEDKRLLPFVNGYFHTDAIKEQIAQKKQSYQHRAVLVKAMKRQLQDMQLSEASAKSLQALESENTFTITTGHQLSLFNGPLYFVYKILQVAKTSAALRVQYPEYNFVPIFWMATEDHDFEEIRKANVFAKTIELEAIDNNFQTVGSLSSCILKQAVEELKGYLETAPYGEDLCKELDAALAASKTLTDFTRYLVQAWFGDYGVLALDGDDAELKACFAPVVEKELQEQFSFKACSLSNEARSTHFKTQVEPREINLFFLDNQQRRRIAPTESGFELLGTDKHFSSEELLQVLQDKPELFSPNVILRPVYQETILPNLAYCGGGGEIAYWTQLKGVFDAIELPFPKLILRNSVVLLDAGVHKKMLKLGLQNTDLFLDTFTLQEHYLEQHSDLTLLDDAQVQASLESFRTVMTEYATAVDPTLKATVEGNIAGQKKFLDGLQKKMKQRLKQQEEVALKQIEGVKEKIYPNGVLQERYEHPYRYLSKYGKLFFQTLYNNLEVNQAVVTVLHVD